MFLTERGQGIVVRMLIGRQIAKSYVVVGRLFDLAGARDPKCNNRKATTAPSARDGTLPTLVHHFVHSWRKSRIGLTRLSLRLRTVPGDSQAASPAAMEEAKKAGRGYKLEIACSPGNPT